ncbi:2-phosphosulfolactate phosphatase [Bacillus pinisoli]|uniref:2-phosphosulfolactate phosphatase n=1 Tax=Bacillus pinisoli TaxID=2901866 RepID=UPI001FF5D57A|nr:2-phosphosulfolactate phosphatase [Bacillus pinisoli]
MIKVHVILKKEDIDEQEMSSGKIAVVFDVLLATSTITAALQFGAKEVIPVLNGEDARRFGAGLSNQEHVLVGEYEGKTIEGFLDPNPLALKEQINGKTVILSTTNGTVAINKSRKAKHVYACSLLNGEAVAEHVLKTRQEETIVVVCSGSSGQFCLEDFFGAGYFLDCLSKNHSLDLTDSAKAALLFFRSYQDHAITTLTDTRVGQMLERVGYSEEIDFVSQCGIFPVVPVLQGNSLKKEMTKTW